jgi:uncharacterized protein
MDHRRQSFAIKYGPWAVIAGASDGLGAAFARHVAVRGLNVVLVARRAHLLGELARELRAAHQVQVSTLAVDLAEPSSLQTLLDGTAELEVGLLVYVASKSSIGPFLDQPLSEHLTGLALNCRGPMVLSHHYGKLMRRRRRGGIVLLSSFSALVGCPMVAHYAATKAYDRVLAESLWGELRGSGVDVLASVVGQTATPQTAARDPDYSHWLAPPEMSSEAVVEDTCAHLGRGGSVITGVGNRVNALLVGLLPRRIATTLVGAVTRKFYRVG